MNDREKHWWLYVLKLEQGRWYVGITTKSPKERFREHTDNIRAAAWTRLYRPQELYGVHDLGVVSEDQAKHEENKKVREYIQKYGIDNVRGGDISQIGVYHDRFGRFFTDDQWYGLRVVMVLTSIMGAVVITYIMQLILK